MTVQACLKDQIGRLVHPGVQAEPVTALRHLFFIASAAAVSGLALAATPLVLASGHVPSWRDALMLAWLVLPLVAAGRVSQTGDLPGGQAIVAAASIGLAWTGFAGRACGADVAVALLLPVMLEGAPGDGARVAGRLAALALANVAVLLMVAGFVPGTSTTGYADGPLAALALLQAGVMVARGQVVAHAAVAPEVTDQPDRVLSDATGDLVVRYDRSGFVLAASGAAERLFGIRTVDLMGRGFFDRVHVADRPAFLHAVNGAATESGPVAVNLRFRQASVANPYGAYAEPVFAWVEVRTRPLDPALPDGAAVMAAVRNITEQVQHEAEIERSRRQAKQANAAKDRFIATVSHELRTPLNSIIGFAEMLASPTLAPQDPAKRQEYAEIIRTSGQHLHAVVNSLLDLSKLDAGKFELCCEPFDIIQLVDTCCDMVRLTAEERRITLRRDVQPGVELLLGDRRACKQILLNLMSNALKFTRPAGRVTVSVRPDGNALLVSVSDTGIGMAARDLAKLGDPFFQAKGGFDRPYEGTGLGLSVVRGLVGLHGGTITVDSAPGEGTSVAVRLPLDGRSPHRVPSAKIEVITRYPRSGGSQHSDRKVQKIA